MDDLALAIKIDWKSRVQITLTRSELQWIETCLITANIGYKHHNSKHAVKKTNKTLNKLSKIIRDDSVALRWG